MIVSANLGNSSYGAFGGEWEDYCDRTYGGEGGNEDYRQRCRKWSVFAPWTAAGKQMRGLPVDWVKTIAEEVVKVVSPPVVTPPPPPTVSPNIVAIKTSVPPTVKVDTPAIVPGIPPDQGQALPPAYHPQAGSGISASVLAAGAIGLAAIFFLKK